LAYGRIFQQQAYALQYNELDPAILAYTMFSTLAVGHGVGGCSGTL